MTEICGDNRFEIIAKAKAHLLDATNIDTSEDEMKVLDTFLFRCWQMGWLDRYDRKTEPQQVTSKLADAVIPTDIERGAWDYKGKSKWEKTEPTISKMEQVETMSCQECKHFHENAVMYLDQCDFCFKDCKYEPKTEPQTERSNNE